MTPSLLCGGDLHLGSGHRIWGSVIAIGDREEWRDHVAPKGEGRRLHWHSGQVLKLDPVIYDSKTSMREECTFARNSVNRLFCCERIPPEHY